MESSFFEQTWRGAHAGGRGAGADGAYGTSARTRISRERSCARRFIQEWARRCGIEQGLGIEWRTKHIEERSAEFEERECELRDEDVEGLDGSVEAQSCSMSYAK